MRIGIVGSEGKKFTSHGEEQARAIIRQLLAPREAIMVSGGCHLGGIDIWAEEEADALGRPKEVYLPKHRSWYDGYRERNLLIASRSDIVHCIAVDRLPSDFQGMTHPNCYHCDRDDHVKSGGCWTMKKAKVGMLHIVQNHVGS